jgi:predicted permease
MELVRELTPTIRSLARRPAYAAAVALTLALGLAAAVGLYSVARSVLLEPLPYAESPRLVALFGAEEGSPRGPMSPADFADLTASATTLRDFAAAHPWSAALTGFEVPERLPGLRATAGLFDLLGVEAAVGRTFLAEEDTPGRDRVVVLSWDLWQRRFGGDRAWVGRRLILNGEPHEVVGVMPRGFGFPPFWAADAELWVPLALDAASAAERNARYLRAFARLAPGAELEAARRETAAVAARLAAENPAPGEPLGLRVEPLLEPVVGDARPVLLVLVAGGLLLYLIAATNVAGLFVARRVDREPEMALRTALGAGRGQLLRPWLFEALVLGAAGAVLGTLGAAWGLRALVALAPADLPRRGEIGLDGGALAAAVMLALLPCLAAALLAGGGRRRAAPRVDDARTVGGARARLRSALVVGQVALASSLLLGAGLAAAALAQLAGTDPGLRRTGLLTASLSLAASPHGEPERQGAFFRELVDEVESLPGVEAAAVVNHLPVAGDTWGTAVLVGGEAEPRRVVQRVASDSYFSVVGTPLVAGRTFAAEDRADGAPVVVVNRRLARLLPGGEEAAVGQLLRSPDGGRPLRIVGVVGDSVQAAVGEAPEPEIVHPYAQNPNPWFRQTSLVVEVSGEPQAVGGALLRRVAELAPDAPLYDLRTMRQVLADDVAGPRWTTLLLALFAAAALGLSVVGLYGVLAFLVGRRRRELGLRLVLGASRRRLLAREVRRGVALAAGGVAIGLAGGGAAADFLATRLPGFTAERPAVFATLAAVVLITAAAAAALPAARALAADPARVLRDGA